MPETSPEYLAGLIVGIKEHLDRQDEQHARDKAEAIAARESRHNENLERFSVLEAKHDQTTGVAIGNQNWIQTVGNPLTVKVDNIHTRVTALEDKNDKDQAEAKGSAKTWAFIAAVGSGVGGIIAGVAEYGRTGLDFIKSLGHGG